MKCRKSSHHPNWVGRFLETLRNDSVQLYWLWARCSYLLVRCVQALQHAWTNFQQLTQQWPAHLWREDNVFTYNVERTPFYRGDTFQIHAPWVKINDIKSVYRAHTLSTHSNLSKNVLKLVAAHFFKVFPSRCFHSLTRRIKYLNFSNVQCNFVSQRFASLVLTMQNAME